MLEGTYGPSPSRWVRDQVAAIEAAGDTRVVTIGDKPVVLLTMRGRTSGLIRKVPLIRVEHHGVYAAVGSIGGAPTNPQWVNNLRAGPDIELQDGIPTYAVRARELEGAERALWWERCVEAFGDYAAYASRTERVFPIFVLEAR